MVVVDAAVASASQDDPGRGHPRTGPVVDTSESVVADGAGVRGQGLSRRWADPHLDPTWSGDGIAGLTGNKYTVAMSPQSSGRLYTASYNEADGGAMRITRFEANGTLGTSFGGGDGVLQRRFAPATNAISFPSHIIRTGDKFVIVGDTRRPHERLGIARVVDQWHLRQHLLRRWSGALPDLRLRTLTSSCRGRSRCSTAGRS